MNIDNIIEEITDFLKQKEYLHALWLEGSLAEDTADEYSDIDLWVDVKDDYVQQAIDDFKQLLDSKGSIDLEHEMEIEHPKLRHITFHIKGMSEFLRIELNIQCHSRELPFRKDVDKIKVLFDKDNSIKFAEPEEIDIAEMIKEQAAKIEFGELWVRREINRNSFLEAYGALRDWVLDPLVGIARLKHSPYKLEYGLKHVYKDLPVDLVNELETLYKNYNIEDISSNLKKALELKARLIK